MNFWKFEHKRRIKELRLIRKAQRAAYKMERKRLRSFYRSQRCINRCQCFNCKGKRMLWGLFFGVLLILWGLSHIVEIIFSIHIPVFGIIFGLFLLYLGVEMITGFAHWPKNCCSHNDTSGHCHGTCMGTARISIDPATLNQQKSPFDYFTIMGTSMIDLKALTPEEVRATGTQLIMHIDTVMGKTDIILNKQLPTRIIAQSACSKVTTPDDCTMSFGSHTFNSHTNQEPLLIIYTSTILGATIIAVE